MPWDEVLCVIGFQNGFSKGESFFMKVLSLSLRLDMLL